jgi:hypothetical protein
MELIPSESTIHREIIPVRDLSGFRALITYWSQTGKTEKVAEAIKTGLEREGLKSSLKKIDELKDEVLYDYDLVCVGSPTHLMLPADPVLEFARKTLDDYRCRGLRRMQSPLLPGKYAAVFCTCGGPHTGLDEAVPAGEWLRSFLEHLGFDVKAKWYVAGDFRGVFEENSPYNIEGRLGDIRGRPNAWDLAKVENDAAELVRKLRFVLGSKS